MYSFWLKASKEMGTSNKTASALKYICQTLSRSTLMNCVFCQGDTSVENSRPQKRTNSIWRRRQCKKCQAVFSTQESVDYEQSFVYQTATGDLEPFQRDKLFLSVYESLKHRKTATEDAKALTSTIMNKLVLKQKQANIDRKLIIECVTVVLKRFDKIALTHYRAFHQST